MLLLILPKSELEQRNVNTQIAIFWGAARNLKKLEITKQFSGDLNKTLIDSGEIAWMVEWAPSNRKVPSSNSS